MNQYTAFRTHYRPGLDELAVISVAMHGQYCGLSRNTPVFFMTKGDHQYPPMPETSELYVGCGDDSLLNEHYGKGNENESAFSLAAKYFGIDMRRYGPIVDEVTREDRHGSDPDHLARMISDLYDMGWDFERVFRWFNTAMIALTDYKTRPEKFAMDMHTCGEAIAKRFGDHEKERWLDVVDQIKKWGKAEFAKACAHLKRNPHFFKEVETYRGVMQIFVPDQVQDNKRIAAAARKMGAKIVLMRGKLDFDDEIGILLQQRKDANLSFSLVLQGLRRLELLARDQLTEETFGLCFGEGTSKVCPVWHGHQAATGQNEAFSIYNCTKTRPCGPKTVLEWESVKDLVFETLKQEPKGEIVKGTSTLIPGGLSLQSAFQSGH